MGRRHQLKNLLARQFPLDLFVFGFPESETEWLRSCARKRITEILEQFKPIVEAETKGEYFVNYGVTPEVDVEGNCIFAVKCRAHHRYRNIPIPAELPDEQYLPEHWSRFPPVGDDRWKRLCLARHNDEEWKFNFVERLRENLSLIISANCGQYCEYKVSYIFVWQKEAVRKFWTGR